jgi:transposase InsO family protein
MCRFSHIHIDLVGPLPLPTSTSGFQYLFTAVDHSTRWAEAFPLRSVAVADCAAALISGSIARFRLTLAVMFTSLVWAATMSSLGIQHKLSTAFHPKRNAAVEWFHRRLKDAQRARAGSCVL